MMDGSPAPDQSSNQGGLEITRREGEVQQPCDGIYLVWFSGAHDLAVGFHWDARGGMTATRPCFAKTSFSFSRSEGPPAFTTAAVSLRKSGPSSAGVTTASALASVCLRLLKP